MSGPPTQQEINLRVLSREQPKDGIGARTVRGGAIAVAAQLIKTALQVVSIAILARLLVPEQFGLVAMAGAVVALLGVVTDLNTATAAIQKEDLDQDTASGMLIMTVAMALAAVALTLLITPLAAWLFHDPRVVGVVIGLMGAAPLAAMGNMHTALLTRNMRWLDLHLISLSGVVAGALAAIAAAAWFGVGYWALVIQAWVSAGAATALAWLICPWRPSWVRDWSGARGSLHFGLNLSATMVLAYIHRQLDNILIGWRWGSVELGFYSRAYSLLQTPLGFLTGPLGTALVPAMSQLQSEPEKWRNAYLDGLAVITFVGAWMACTLYGGAGAIVDLLLGPNWAETKQIFANLAVAMLVATPMRTTGWIYISLGRTNRMLQWGLIAVPVYALSFVIGLPWAGRGVALAFSISQLLAFFPCMWMAVRDTNITMRSVLAVVAAPIALSVAVALALGAIVPRLDLFFGIGAVGVAALVYAVGSVVLVWRMPIYARLKQRAESTLTALLQRLTLRPAQ